MGHTITVLIGNLPASVGQPSEELVNNARLLDKFYIPTRDQNGFDSGVPTDCYTADEAKRAIRSGIDV